MNHDMGRTAHSRTFQVELSPAVYNALVTRLIEINSADFELAKDEHRGFNSTTPAEYVEELILVNLAENGLLKKK